MRLLGHTVIFVTFITGLSEGNSVTQRDTSLARREGESATLVCTYSGDDYFLYWYRRYPGGQPEFVLTRYSAGGFEFQADFAGGRFEDQVGRSEKKYYLTISSLVLSDTAVYYCALREHWVLGYAYREKMTFGAGTELIVQPNKETTEPKLSIFYPHVSQSKETQSSDRAAVCLLSEFYPKEAQIFMSMNTTIDVTTPSKLNVNTGYYSSSGYLQFQRDHETNNITCMVKFQDRDIGPIFEKHRPEERATDTLECETLTSSNHTGAVITGLPEKNFMSLTVMGLRILFFKSVAFNVLMTARAWVF